MSGAEERELGQRVGGALTLIKPGPPPTAGIMRRGRGIRRRRRAAGAGAVAVVAVVAAVAVAVPGLLHAVAHIGHSPGPSARPLTVSRLGPVARDGVIGSGTIGGQHWTLYQFGDGELIWSLGGSGTFARQSSGRVDLLALLRESSEPVPLTHFDAVWPDSSQRARALDGLVADGLVDPLPDGRFALPALRPMHTRKRGRHRRPRFPTPQAPSRAPEPSLAPRLT